MNETPTDRLPGFDTSCVAGSEFAAGLQKIASLDVEGPEARVAADELAAIAADLADRIEEGR